ncbi:hypothetical protein SAMN05444397_104275 [Flavobacterium aquidurense]|uniref:Uncharacterized protein n=1 Tax=Flavobacterium frigidimaris TaxID=262320 RepID=A0ABX4BLV7_FLAFR|nr:hypothetical protein [Flavobacterium frigidimaris]OXA77095.1 hypothetical protein B0A65_17490 [Flavobacterium frigidimaris]SDZ23397.1 hypothetical protein SAMN05444397_104275 [Flavobacterium aquidurense]
MKNKILIALSVFALYSCQNKEKPASKNIIKTIVQDTLSKTLGGTANLSEVTAKNDKEVELIRKQLSILLKKDLPVMTKDERFFYYEAYDLNNDKKDEYFVGFSNPYFCGSGGCSGYILNNDGSVINKFTVTDFPIFIGTTASENFKDLIFNSGNTLHSLKMKNGKYPSNPSVQEKWKGNIPAASPVVLDIYAKKLEKYSF